MNLIYKLHPGGGATRKTREFELEHLRQNLGHAADGGSAWAGGAAGGARGASAAGGAAACALFKASSVKGIMPFALLA